MGAKHFALITLMNSFPQFYVKEKAGWKVQACSLGAGLKALRVNEARI